MRLELFKNKAGFVSRGTMHCSACRGSEIGWFHTGRFWRTKWWALSKHL